LAGLWNVAQTLLSIKSSIVGEFSELKPEIDVIEHWLDQLPRLDKELEFWKNRSIAGAIPIIKKDERYAETTGNKEITGYAPPLLGVLSTNPVWSALWYSTESPLGSVFRRFQAWYFAAFLQLQKKGDLKDLGVELYRAGLLIRRLNYPERCVELDRFALAGSMQDALPILIKLGDVPKKTWLEYGYRALATLLRRAFMPDSHGLSQESDKKARGQNKKKEAGTPRNSSFGHYDLILPGHTLFDSLLERESWFGHTDLPRIRLEMTVPSSEVAEELAVDGVSPGEYAECEGVQVQLDDIDSRFLERPQELPPLASIFGIARARARAVMMDAQRFRTRLTRVLVADVHQVMRVLDSAFASALLQRSAPGVTASRSGQQFSEAILLAAASLVTGVSQEELLGMQLYDAVEEIPNQNQYTIGYSPKYKVWIRPYQSPERKSLDLEGRAQTLKEVPRVVINDVLGVGLHWTSLLEKGEFPSRLSTYQKIFQEEVEPKLVAAGVSPRWCRFAALADLLPSWFAGLEESDDLRCSLLFGRESAAAATSRYYTVIERSSLNDWYVKELSSMLFRMKADGLRLSSGLFTEPPLTVIPKSFVGDDRTLRVAVVMALMKKLQSGLSQKKDAEDLVTRHNRYTAYVALGLAMATGCRLVRTPVPDLRVALAADGFLPLQEKDRSDGNHARIVWLPESIRTQISYYLEHLGELWLQLPAGISNTGWIEATKQRDRSRFGGERFAINWLHTFFFLENDPRGLRPVELSGTRLKKYLDAELPDQWPVANANRHVFRSFLTNDGCPANVINAAMGHWQYGESVWDPYSAFDPMQYRNAIRPHLDTLMAAIGFEPLRA
jgi:hypothetical protein